MVVIFVDNKYWYIDCLLIINALEKYIFLYLGKYSFQDYNIDHKETKCPQNMTSLVPVALAFQIFALMTHSQIISQVSLMVLGKSQLL